MSVGYNLEGIRSPRVRSWIQSMQNAAAGDRTLRAELSGEFARYRDLPFPTCISDTVSLSTFHGCPAGEIEGIVTFLLVEMGCHVCIKLNPTLLGKEEVGAPAARRAGLSRDPTASAGIRERPAIRRGPGPDSAAPALSPTSTAEASR